MSNRENAQDETRVSRSRRHSKEKQEFRKQLRIAIPAAIVSGCVGAIVGFGLNVGLALPRTPNFDLALGTGVVSDSYFAPVPPNWNNCGAEQASLLGLGKVRGCAFIDRGKLVLDAVIMVPPSSRRDWAGSFVARLTPFARKGQGTFRQLRDYRINCMLEIRQSGTCHLQVAYSKYTPGAEYYLAM
jgi:hypothetical protein